MTLWTNDSLHQALKEILIEPIKHSKDKNLHSLAGFDAVFIDTRKPTPNSVFVAIKGENTDGHNYLKQAVDAGAKVAIVHNIPKDSQDLDLIFIVVKDTIQALNKLAEFARLRSKAKIFAITGSVGKTSTKEMLKIAFESQGRTYANVGNLNNHIGLPLSLSNLPIDCEYAIFEMGMNHLGEIEPLSKLAKPHLVVITNVGPVHIEFFKDEQEIALAKSEIFTGLMVGGYAMINRDNPHFEFLFNRARANKINEENIINFGTNHRANYQITHTEIKSSNLTLVSLKLKNGKNISYEVSCINQAVIFNSAIIVVACDLFGKNLQNALDAIKNYSSGAGRGKVTEINYNNKNITVIDDTYNASLLSMKAGIENSSNLKKILQRKRVVCALGDMLELGEKSTDLHFKVVNYLKEYNIDYAILVGPKMKEASINLDDKTFTTFDNSILASENFMDLLQDGDIFYLKGSRGTRMERILEKLTNKNSDH